MGGGSEHWRNICNVKFMGNIQKEGGGEKINGRSFQQTCFMKFFIASGISNQINCVLKPCVEIMFVVTVFMTCRARLKVKDQGQRTSYEDKSQTTE